MRNTMHWRMTDPLDVRADEWLVDVTKYAWSCKVSAQPFPKDPDTLERFSSEARELSNVQECYGFSSRWSVPEGEDHRVNHNDTRR